MTGRNGQNKCQEVELIGLVTTWTCQGRGGGYDFKLSGLDFWVDEYTLREENELGG